jgi:NAD(P)H-flavin reductase
LISKGFPTRTLLGFRDLEHSGAVESLFGCEEVRLAFEDGSSGHHGYVTDLLELLLKRDDPGGAVVYSCGPPAMLEAVKKICGSAGVPVLPGSTLGFDSPAPALGQVEQPRLKQPRRLRPDQEPP